jgi:hypothetical protein
MVAQETLTGKQTLSGLKGKQNTIRRICSLKINLFLRNMLAHVRF